MKYSDQLAEWLVSLGYSHCFYVAGGNIMHLLESCSRRMTCIPFVHEVAAGIAAEYFTQVSDKGKAFALVTAGPGLTNIITAMAGAYLESHELLVLGGQVKTADLAHGALRQRGIQEIAGVDIAAPITVTSAVMEETFDRGRFADLVMSGSCGRKGPVFIEIPLDIQGQNFLSDENQGGGPRLVSDVPAISSDILDQMVNWIRTASRPIILIGGGVDRDVAWSMLDGLASAGIPLMTTWNGADRVPSDHPLYFGRPNTWGQRSANLLLQQSDLVVVLGSRLGLQQTGFNWQKFVYNGRVIQVDCDRAELEKGHPRVDLPVCGDANQVLRYLATVGSLGRHESWVSFCTRARLAVPLREPINQTADQYLSPYLFCSILSDLCGSDDVIIPCSSGGAFTVMMQVFQQKARQIIVTNKGLASMGYGLSGAIGAAIAAAGRRTILVEGDGGFAQNLQEVGTVAINALNLKMFIFDDGGYASIRMTQRSYFGGRYVGCDRTTGLGLPRWDVLFSAYDVPTYCLEPGFESDPEFHVLFDRPGPVAFLVRIDPMQTYFPKITSRITETGSMESNPLHVMSPPLDEELMRTVGQYLTPDA